MPYIKQEDREQFSSLLEDVVNQMTMGNEPDLVRGEFFGYWANRVVKRFLGDPEYTRDTFNSALFNEERRKLLANNADKISTLLTRSDPLGAAGNCNFCISFVYWGLVGDSDNVSEARYGVRAYLRGILDLVSDSLERIDSGNQRDRTMSFRRYLVLKGVLKDIDSEVYRRKTVPYEDSKISENGDLWHNGKMLRLTEGKLLE